MDEETRLFVRPSVSKFDTLTERTIVAAVR